MHSFPKIFQQSRVSVALFLLGGIIYALGAATRVAVPGMAFDKIREGLSFSDSQTSGIASAGVIGCMVFISFSGMLIDRYGWKKMIIPGACLQVAGEFFVYSSANLFLIYAGAFINGGGRTILYLVLLKFLDVEFERRYFSLLIGAFYIFSYGGTFLGTSPFAILLKQYSWQELIAFSNHVTTACALLIAMLLFFFKGRKTERQAKQERESVSIRELLSYLRNRECFCVFFLTAAGISVYWSIMAGFAAKYNAGRSSGSLGIMNLIVMAEMIAGGAVSCWLGNRRRIFQITGSLLTVSGLLVLLAGTFVQPSWAAYAGFCLIGAGYGCTCVNISTVREFVPVKFAACAIGLVNFAANIMIILLNQLSGRIFDCFPIMGNAITQSGCRIAVSAFLIPALFAVPCAFLIRDTRGKNITEDSTENPAF